MHITVCICTRNRGESIVSTLRSVMKSHYQDFDIVVVDQSTDDTTERAVHGIRDDDSRLTYIPSSTTGLSFARNICIKNARGPIVAFTDDDCEVSAEWLDLIVMSFREHPALGQICGAVIPGPHDHSRGFIPDYPVASRREIDSPWKKWQDGGIGANMAFRLDTLRVVGPFDEVLSAGAALHTCEDGDMTYRVLKGGYRVLELPEAYVVHHGFRTWAQGQAMMHNVGLGVAAAYMKHLRMRDPAILPTLIIEWWRCISWKRLFLLRRHSGLRRFLGYSQGLVMSFRYGVDAQQRLYKPSSRDIPAVTGYGKTRDVMVD